MPEILKPYSASEEKNPKLNTPTSNGKIADSIPLFENLVTKEQLAKSISVSKSYINKLMSKEGLPHVRIGRSVRYSVKEVMAWLKQRSYP